MSEARDHDAGEGRLPLAPAEKLLLATLRAWAASPTAGLRRRVCQALAERTDGRVAALFSAWVQAVDAARLRPMIMCCRHCDGPGPDLQRLVLACGVARVDPDLGGELIGSLVFETQAVMTLARALNTALAGCGWPLPNRLETARDAGAPHSLH